MYISFILEKAVVTVLPVPGSLQVTRDNLPIYPVDTPICGMPLAMIGILWPIVMVTGATIPAWGGTPSSAVNMCRWSKIIWWGVGLQDYMMLLYRKCKQLQELLLLINVHSKYYVYNNHQQPQIKYSHLLLACYE